MKKNSHLKSINEGLQLENQMLNEEISEGIKIIGQGSEDLRYEAGREEVLRKENIKLNERLSKIKKEYRIIQSQLKAKKVNNHNIQQENKALKKKIEQETTRLFSSQNLKSTSEGRVVQNNFPKLMDHLKAQNFQIKEKSILLNVFQTLIDVTLANEFSGVTWKAIVDSNNSVIGARLKFENLSMLKTDLKVLYKDSINSLGKSFGASGLKLQTSIEESGGVVNSLDFKVSLPVSTIYREANQLP